MTLLKNMSLNDVCLSLHISIDKAIEMLNEEPRDYEII